MPKPDNKQLLQIRISKKLFLEIKEHKDKYYEHLNMSSFFIQVMRDRIEEDRRK